MNQGIIKIREASAGDAESLSSFASQAFLQAYSGTMNDEDIRNYISKSFDQNQVRLQLDSHVMIFHLALNNDEIIGYTKLRWDRKRTELKDFNSIELERIYVSGIYYRIGLGSLLFRNAIEFSKKNGFNILWLAVWQKNERALSFYKKSGMEIFGVQEFTVGRIINNDYVLKINL